VTRDDPPLGWRAPWLVAFAATVTMLSRLWEGDLFRDEVLYAAVAKTMVAGGDWLHLHLGPDPYWNKPPLVFWLAGLAYRVLGPSVFTAKVFPAIFGVGACVVLYFLARRLTGERVALLAGLVLATTPRFVRTSATFRLDSAVTFFTLLALLLYLRALDRPGLGTWLAAGAAWGLGVMAKGAFGLTGPYFFAVYLLVEGRLRLLVSRGFLASVAVGAAVCLPWHVLQVVHSGTAFLHVYVGSQVIDRLTGRLWQGPRTSYLPAFVQDDWPWLLFLAVGIPTAVAAAWRGDRGLRYVLAWAGMYVALLALSVDKRARYLYQLYPPLAVLTAVGIDRLLPAGWRRHVPRAAAIVFATAGFALLIVPVPLHSEGAAELKALGPVLESVAPGSRAPLTGFRIISVNVRAAALFYLDRDLRDHERLPDLPRTPGGLVLTTPEWAPMLEKRGFTRVYANPKYVLERDADPTPPTPPAPEPAGQCDSTSIPPGWTREGPGGAGVSAAGAAASQVGPRALAWAAWLHTGLGVPFAKVATILRTGFGLTITPGGLVQALHRVGQHTAPTYQALVAVVRRSPIVAPDETGWKVGGRLW
jgi:4-amino-4-deoxy-L-arabinose transferase-like glycosyltransferase